MFARNSHFAFHGFTVLLAPIVALTHWLFTLIPEAFPAGRSKATSFALLSRGLDQAAAHLMRLIAASLHAASVGLLAALPIGFVNDWRRLASL